MNATTDPTGCDSARNTPAVDTIPMPRLSDDAVIQIHDFIHHVLDLFEARYGDQIQRFHEGLYDDCFFEPDSTGTAADPPF